MTNRVADETPSAIASSPARPRRLRRSISLAVGAVLLTAALVGGAAATPSAREVRNAPPPPATYTNPIGAGVADDFADPSVIRGRDGYWYAYATQTPLVEGSDQRHLLPILRSPDLVNWEHVGDVFDESNVPSWLGESGAWGSAIEYWDGRYRLFFVGVNIPGHPRPNKSIGVATAPTPYGPWTDSGGPIIDPAYYVRPPGEAERARSIIAPDAVQAADGRRYLYYGGFNGGIWVVELGDGMTPVGEPVQLVGEAHLEGGYVIRRDGWYYMFTSANHCCLGGPVSGYAGWVARSKSPTGPFVDRNGVPVLGLRPGGTPVVTANGNRWVGLGANAVATDIAGQDWLFYHGIDRDDPYLNGPYQGGLQRGLLIDRLDWIDGWPTVREGRGTSQGPTPAPDVQARTADTFETGGLRQTWRNPTGWKVRKEPAGGYLHGDASGGTRTLTARAPIGGDARLRAAIRLPDGDGRAGLRLFDRGDAPDAAPAGRVDVVVDGGVDGDGPALEIAVSAPGAAVDRTRRALPEGFDAGRWHQLTAEIRAGALSVTMADHGTDHPVAQAEVDLPASLRAGTMSLLATGSRAEFDDVTASEPHVPHTDAAPAPHRGVLDPALSDEFDGAGLAEDWRWIRDPAAAVGDGVLSFPIQSGNVIGPDNSSSLVTRELPTDQTWTVETEVETDITDEPLHGFPMAGLIVYAADDEALAHVVHGRNVVRDTRLARDTVYAGRLRTGQSFTGPPGASGTTLRLRHTVDPATGAHRFRGAASPDGEHWTWGAVYTMPADTEFDVGLMTGGQSPLDPAATARFDHLRVFRPAGG